MRFGLKLLILIGFGVYAATLLILYLNQRSMMFFPSREGTSASDMGFTEFRP